MQKKKNVSSVGHLYLWHKIIFSSICKMFTNINELLFTQLFFRHKTLGQEGLRNTAIKLFEFGMDFAPSCGVWMGLRSTGTLQHLNQ